MSENTPGSGAATPAPPHPGQHTSPDGIALLLEFHARVRSELKTLRMIIAGLQRRDSESLYETTAAAAEVVRFLELTTPMHEQDEVDSLFPRLAVGLRRASELQSEVAREIEQAESEHENFQAVWVPLLHWLCQLSTPDGIVSIEQFIKAVDNIEEHFLHHFEREESVLFTAARRLLRADELQDMAAEIHERRT